MALSLPCNSGDDRRFPEPILTDVCVASSVEIVSVLISPVFFIACKMCQNYDAIDKILLGRSLRLADSVGIIRQAKRLASHGKRWAGHKKCDFMISRSFSTLYAIKHLTCTGRLTKLRVITMPYMHTLIKSITSIIIIIIIIITPWV
jgi:hypothetical protein